MSNPPSPYLSPLTSGDANSLFSQLEVDATNYSLYQVKTAASAGHMPPWQVLCFASSVVKLGSPSPRFEAASAAHGGPNSGAVLLARQRKKKHKRAVSNGYAVFHGLVPSAYRTWLEAALQVKGVAGAIHKGYPSFAAAQAAFEYARVRSWIRACSTTPLISTPSIDISSLSAPASAVMEADNPLHVRDPAIGKAWYVAFRGITPGVYESYLECALNTTGLTCVTYEAVPTNAIAIARFQAAERAGVIFQLTC
ncbi:hypothetical protein C8R45DRAFT_1115752 [Mycena sanguinolenta]|nr:hypothetical protein C8R45DRAFT_1115752 [Mycena sanguinolenta]